MLKTNFERKTISRQFGNADRKQQKIISPQFSFYFRCASTQRALVMILSGLDTGRNHQIQTKNKASCFVSANKINLISGHQDECVNILHSSFE